MKHFFFEEKQSQETDYAVQTINTLNLLEQFNIVPTLPQYDTTLPPTSSTTLTTSEISQSMATMSYTTPTTHLEDIILSPLSENEESRKKTLEFDNEDLIIKKAKWNEIQQKKHLL